MVERCVKHNFETVENTCRTCGRGYCNECLVYSFGPKKPPYCVSCALAAAGVRRSAAAQPVRAQKNRRLFGRKSEPVVEPVAIGFDDIPIEFPEGYEMSPAARRLKPQPQPTVFLDPEPAFIEPEPVLVGAEPDFPPYTSPNAPEDTLDSWGASLDSANGGWPSDSNGLSTADADEEHWTSTAAPWPEVRPKGPSTGSF